MYIHLKKAINLTNTVIAAALICTAAAQADVLKKPEALLEVLSSANTPAPRLGAAIPAPQWPAPALRVTTLRLTPAGLAPLAFVDAPASGFAQTARAIPAIALPAGLVALERQNRIATASIPSIGITTASIPIPAPRPDAPRLSSTIPQDRPLFGAHRIRFGKIGSGIRISGLIRKAAASGASAICINSCASLADSLDLGSADITTQLRHVSATVNRLVTYRTDEENHGRLDQWSTPNETLARASGDCEDYAILKMAVLAKLGVPVNAMEIIIVKDTSRRLFHAVLSVTLQDRTLVLDNMTDAVEPDTAKHSYAPLFSLSGNANYVFGYKGGKQNLTASLRHIASIAPGAGF